LWLVVSCGEKAAYNGWERRLSSGSEKMGNNGKYKFE
jgi:hypothetical protein